MRSKGPVIATIAAIAAIVAVVGFGIVLHLSGGGPLPVDVWWHDRVGVAPETAPYAFALGLANIGSAIGVSICGLVVVVLLLLRQRPREAILVAVSLLAAVLANEVIKAFVARPRPGDRLIDPNGASYPSGHSMGAAALGTVIVLIVLDIERRSRTIVAVAVTLAVAWILIMVWSRTALHVHWLSDTLAGVLLGAGVAVLTRRLFGSRAPAPRRMR